MSPPDSVPACCKVSDRVATRASILTPTTACEATRDRQATPGTRRRPRLLHRRYRRPTPGHRPTKTLPRLPVRLHLPQMPTTRTARAPRPQRLHHTGGRRTITTLATPPSTPSSMTDQTNEQRVALPPSQLPDFISEGVRELGLQHALEEEAQCVQLALDGLPRYLRWLVRHPRLQRPERRRRR